MVAENTYGFIKLVRVFLLQLFSNQGKSLFLIFDEKEDDVVLF